MCLQSAVMGTYRDTLVVVLLLFRVIFDRESVPSWSGLASGLFIQFTVVFLFLRDRGSVTLFILGTPASLGHFGRTVMMDATR